MTIGKGIGGSSRQQALHRIQSQGGEGIPIALEEYHQRLAKVRDLMSQSNVDVLYLDATTSLRYFTGLACNPSERMHGVLVSQGQLVYVCPAFEEQKTRAGMLVEGDYLVWAEHEDPTIKVIEAVRRLTSGSGAKLALDPQTPYFTASRLQQWDAKVEVVNGESLVAACRRIKSDSELALLSLAKKITLEVHLQAASILREGIDTREVQAFLDEAHVAAGMDGRSTFKIVLFGETTAYPHGVPYPTQLKQGDMVLIDTGATIQGYHSDITRTYVFGEPSARQREIWELEKAAQQAAFEAIEVGAPCSVIDDAARRVITEGGLGPDYQLPGLPHRTGHGVGMDVHEEPYIVRGNDLPLQPGMCFSIEPMICSYGEFGVRLEDHAYVTADGGRWFTPPSESLDNPLNL